MTLTNSLYFVLAGLVLTTAPAFAQVSADQAKQYFSEAAALCAWEAGALWKTSFCGPIVIYDAPTETIATNQAAPAVRRPAVLGYANAAMDWGGVRWTTLAWRTIPVDPHLRAQLLIHELFHRIQPKLGLLGPDGHNEHLDMMEGRYLLQLEWRALEAALGSRGAPRQAALNDALTFRQSRRHLFPGAAENERRLEINEGLAQYTATVVTAVSLEEAERDAIYQLMNASLSATFVRTFPYSLGVAYGLLLDSLTPGWRQRVTITDDLGSMVGAAANLHPAEDAGPIANRYGGQQLRTYEELRDTERKERVSEIRQRYVNGPVFLLPPAKTSAYLTNGITPVPGLGTLFPHFRGSGDWGTVDAASVVVREDGALILAGPKSIGTRSVSGEGWTVVTIDGWQTVKGPREGDYRTVPAAAQPPLQMILSIPAPAENARPR